MNDLVLNYLLPTAEKGDEYGNATPTSNVCSAAPLACGWRG